MASIKVAVRSRPLNKREIEMRSQLIINMESQSCCITNIKLPIGGNDTLGRERVKNFTYDYAYWSTEPLAPNYASQKTLYNDLGCDVVKSAYDGYNACVFAYGQTGSGKTFTMMGGQTSDDYGLIPRICQMMFQQMTDPETTYRTEVSYLEIYNERVRDLLRDENHRTRNLRVREHPKEGPYVQDLSKHLVVNYNDIDELINQGNANRTTAATNMNDVSSRSHAIFSIVFTQANFKDDLPSEVHSKINLVDLAGSERADAAGTTGERLKEGGSINKSLVTLGNVISTLADLSDKYKPGPKNHVFIPYRDSVLTWLLKDSLGGNAKTIMIATVSPADCNYAETLSTLRYANRAKRIMNKPTVNEDPNVRLIRELREENARLRDLLGNNVDLFSTVAAQEKLNQNEERVRQLTEKWADKWQETAKILEEHQSLALRREGTGVVLDSELPYLLAIDDNVLSTGMRLYHIKEGDTTVGREDAGVKQDIALTGKYVEAEHCIIRHHHGEVVLVPRPGARCSINHSSVHEPTRLSQGMIIRLGKNHIFRFNHPMEAEKLREQFKMTGPTQMLQVHHDFQWTWSTLSMNDSAVGSDFDLESERGSCGDATLERLEERRREVEQAEEEHVFAEARRLAALAEQEEQQRRLEQQEAEVGRMRQQTQQAQEEFRRLSQRFESQLVIQLKQKETVEEEAERLKEERKRVEAEKQRVREKRARVRAEREAARVREEVEAARQAIEREELRLEKERIDETRDTLSLNLIKEKEQSERARQIEECLYKEGMASMRNLVEQEVKDMRKIVGLPEVTSQEDVVAGLPTIKEESSDDDELDVSSLRLVLSPGSNPAIPLQYLTQSPSDSSHITSQLESCEKPVPDWSQDEINMHMTSLWEQVQQVRVNVFQSLHKKYTSILSSDDQTEQLGEEVVESFENIKPLFDQLQQLSSLNVANVALLERLQEYDRALTTVDTFLQIHSIIQSIEKAMRKQHYLKVVEQTAGLQSLMEVADTHLDAEQELERSVQKLFSTEMCILREKFLFGLTETWNDLLKWTLPSESRRMANKPRTVTLEVTDVDVKRDVLTCTVQAMYDVNMLESRLKTLCERIVQYFIEPVVMDRNTLLQVIEETEKYICVVLSPTLGSSKVAVPPAEVFMKLEEIFLFLHRPLHNIIVHETEKDGKMQAVTLVEKIGSMICKKLFECIYNQCLCHVIPKCSRQFDKFNEIVTLTENFQDLLTRLHFLSAEYSTLMDYLNNVNNLFANIKSQEMLKKAHEFMTQELLTSVEISSEHPLGMPNKDGEPNQQEEFVKQCKEQAGTTNYKLPTCQISVPMRSLVSMAYDTLHDALESGPDGAVHMANSVHNMFELYCDVVPSYHKEKLTNLPLLAALHHNNCMFVAHHLITVDKTFQNKLKSEAGTLPIEAPNMGDLVPRVRKLGNDAFTKHINMKKERMIDYLSDTQGFECIADDEGQGAKAAVKHMLNHLRHITSIWKDILPTNIFFKAVGSLLNSAVDEIIGSVLSIEEFSADDCDYLQDVLSHISESGPDYFQTSDPKLNPQVVIHEFVPSWLRFRELVSIFSMSLADLSDRWADSKGPLGLVFTPEELRRIVLAMFENTSRRDTLLKQLRRSSVSLPLQTEDRCVFTSF